MPKDDKHEGWHTQTCAQILKYFDVSSETGLDNKKVTVNRKNFGENLISQGAKKSKIKIFFKQFYNVMTVLLGSAAVISAILEWANGQKNYLDSILIFVIIFANALIGFIQELRAQKAIDFLKKLSSPTATVLRNGLTFKIPTSEVVAGDILVLKSGDCVSADARLIFTNDLKVDESALTGESDEVLKDENAILNPKTPTADRKNMVFSTSFVASGNGVAVVTDVGANTIVGKFAKFVNEEKSENTLLQKRLAETSKILGIGVVFISAVLITLGIIQKIDFIELFMLCVSLAVSALPEGLPAVITVILAVGARRLTKKHAICKNLSAVENLGNISVICTDKTGTLTKNKMVVQKVFDYSREHSQNDEFSEKFFTFASLCNDSKITDSKKFEISGSPTENALLMAAIKNGITPRFLESNFHRLREIPFDSKTKTMTTLNTIKKQRKFSKKYLIVIKGAAEVIAKKCAFVDDLDEIVPITPEISHKINFEIEKMAKSAYRVLAVAYKNTDSVYDNCDSGLIFLGMAGINDEIRPEAKVAVKTAIQAGIKPVIVTGDHILTASAIAKKVGILKSDNEVLSGAEIDEMDDKSLEKNIFSYSVFARVTAEHKLRIVKAFQRKKAIVAMVGDGINDVLALKNSDVGCAMGKIGTDAAKSVSDIILTDDNFVTIVEAIRGGRGIYSNIRKTLHYLISTNIGEILMVLVCFLMKLPPPLAAVHLLWLNMVTDGFPAFALGFEAFEPEIMQKKPLNPEKKLFSDGLGFSIVLEGCFIGSIALLTYTIGRICFCENGVIANTMVFCCLGFSQLFHAFNVRSERSILKSGIFENKKLIFSTAFCVFLQILVVIIPTFAEFFRIQNLNFLQWVIVIIMSMSPFLISEIEKFFAS